MNFRPHLLAVAALCAPCAKADEVDRLAPDFVTTSLVYASPGDGMFSSVGHAFLRMRCPTYNLDNCFTYEHEKGENIFLSTFFERLKMGLFVVPTAEYLKEFSDAGRSVEEYTLDIPPDMEQRLWRNFDTLAARGPIYPYDYIYKACTLTIPRFLAEAAPPHKFVPGRFGAREALSRREVAKDGFRTSPWTFLLLNMAVGTEFDRPCSTMAKVFSPRDLIEFLATSTIDGRPVLARESRCELLPLGETPPRPCWFSPMLAASLLVALAVANFFLRSKWIDYAFLALLVPASLFMAYVYGLSTLPASNWSWLFVPINLLPVICWRWRRYWAIPYTAVLAVWETAMILSQHALTDPAYLAATVAYMLVYARQWRR